MRYKNKIRRFVQSFTKVKYLNNISLLAARLI